MPPGMSQSRRKATATSPSIARGPHPPTHHVRASPRSHRAPTDAKLMRPPPWPPRVLSVSERPPLSQPLPTQRTRAGSSSSSSRSRSRSSKREKAPCRQQRRRRQQRQKASNRERERGRRHHYLLLLAMLLVLRQLSCLPSRSLRRPHLSPRSRKGRPHPSQLRTGTSPGRSQSCRRSSGMSPGGSTSTVGRYPLMCPTTAG
mmetsp:Transcript_30600/g.88992  ORF Transcript_30600/g.88992 Transcript_30600/m.88992 type:complete len:202 (+) Transcript_30600:64-669(+)